MTRATYLWIDSTNRRSNETVTVSANQSVSLNLSGASARLATITCVLSSSALQDMDVASEVQQYWGTFTQHQNRNADHATACEPLGAISSCGVFSNGSGSLRTNTRLPQSCGA